MNESKIIKNLQSGKEEKAFRALYKFYPKVEKHILINSGSKEEALDIFQDALIVLYNKVIGLRPASQRGEVPQPATAETQKDNANQTETNAAPQLAGFLINTCKLLWSNELRKKKVRTGSEDALTSLAFKDDINEQLEKETKHQIVDEAINKLGKKCQEILELFYYKSLSMDSIAKKFGYKTVKSAKVQKYKCMESARKFALELINEKN